MIQVNRLVWPVWPDIFRIRSNCNKTSDKWPYEMIQSFGLHMRIYCRYTAPETSWPRVYRNLGNDNFGPWCPTKFVKWFDCATECKIHVVSQSVSVPKLLHSERAVWFSTCLFVCLLVGWFVGLFVRLFCFVPPVLKNHILSSQKVHYIRWHFSKFTNFRQKLRQKHTKATRVSWVVLFPVRYTWTCSLSIDVNGLYGWTLLSFWLTIQRWQM